MAFERLQELTTITESQKYWGSDAPHQKEYSELFKKLVKPSGPSDTVEGELLRAANKIYYDYYNNGFGNNWSGALNFLEHQARFDVKKEFAALQEYSTGKVFDGNESAIEAVLDSLVDKVVDYIKSVGENLTPYDGDMYDYQEKAYVAPEEEDDDFDEDENPED